MMPNIVVQRRTRPFRVADLFCGAGGSSTGAARALRELGMQMDLVAANHWPTAIETHTRNHPGAAHHCVDLEHARPRELVPGGVLDLLIASPTCTYHSRARGGRPVTDQQRMDPWHVVRWCTELRVHRIMIENVPEFVDWGPCDIRTGRPIKRRRGEYFRAWCDALKSIGFRLDCRVLCCADYGDPTTRRRFFLIGRSDGGALRWPEPSHAESDNGNLFGALQRWRGATEIIDWGRRGRSIFGRAKPLRPNTIRRILAGAERYSWPQAHVDALRALLEGREPQLDVPAPAAEPLLLQFRGTDSSALRRTATPLDAPVPALTAGGGHLGLVLAVGAGGAARGLEQPVPTITAGGNGARPAVAEPLIVHRCNSDGGRSARPVAEPCPTVATRGAGYLAQALLMGTSGSALAKPVTAPAPTITTGGASNEARPGCARPQLIEPLIAPYYGSGSGETSQPATSPLPAVTTKARFGMAEAVIVSPRHAREGAGPRPRGENDPLPTVTAGGSQFGLAEPLVVSLSNSSSEGVPRPAAAPLRTITTAKGGDMGVAEPFVLPVTHHGEGRTYAVERPLPTVTGANRGELGLAEPIASGYRIDIHYRMLHWRELAAAMSFDDEGEIYDFAGTATDITKQIGNAVPSRTAKALVRALVQP